MQTVIEIPTKT